MNCEDDKQDRFQISEDKDLDDLDAKSIPEKTKQRAMWTFRLYETWAQWRTSSVGDKLMVNVALGAMLEEYLNEVLCQFIGEVKKEDEGRYPWKTLHE